MDRILTYGRDRPGAIDLAGKKQAADLAISDLDGVKIDRSFVADVLRDPDDLALTTAIISMAHSIGITVVAEGVEQEGQFDVLRERGCDLGQGFWLGHPLTARAFDALLR